LQETDKLKLAADAYKKELLQQKVSELQTELAQTNKRLKVAEEEKTGTFAYTSVVCCQQAGCFLMLDCVCRTMTIVTQHIAMFNAYDLY